MEVRFGLLLPSAAQFTWYLNPQGCPHLMKLHLPFSPHVTVATGSFITSPCLLWEPLHIPTIAPCHSVPLSLSNTSLLCGPVVRGTSHCLVFRALLWNVQPSLFPAVIVCAFLSIFPSFLCILIFSILYCAVLTFCSHIAIFSFLSGESVMLQLVSLCSQLCLSCFAFLVM